ncbi:hypothetical protein GQ42DRAFT_165212 [Ramicandelaber brevisporus]|nr:hypothetical protein GQ42DRAFT_165212 [Ramicandelaber brevisporus]
MPMSPSSTVLVFWSHRIPLLLPLSRGFRSVSLCVCLSGYSFDSFGRPFRTHLLGFKPADQDASCYRTFPIT